MSGHRNPSTVEMKSSKDITEETWVSHVRSNSGKLVEESKIFERNELICSLYCDRNHKP